METVEMRMPTGLPTDTLAVWRVTDGAHLTGGQTIFDFETTEAVALARRPPSDPARPCAA